MRARLNDAEFRPTALARRSRSTISLTNAWRAGTSNAAPAPNTKAMHVDVPRATDSGDGEHAEQGGGGAHGHLGDDEDAPLRVAVGETPGDGRQQHDRQELEPGGDAEGAGAAGEREHEPVLGDALHPRADVGDERAGGEQPVVADPQRGERGPHEPASRSSIGATRAAARARRGRGHRGGAPATRRAGGDRRRGPRGPRR